jgi:hypothetical protein
MWQSRLNSLETQWKLKLQTERERHELEIRKLRGELESSSSEHNTLTVKRLLRRWQHRFLSSAFKTWYDVTTQDAMDRRELESSVFRVVVALKKMQHQEKARAWQTWRSHTLRSRSHSEMSRQRLDSTTVLRGHAARSVFRSLKRWRVRILSYTA